MPLRGFVGVLVRFFGIFYSDMFTCSNCREKRIQRFSGVSHVIFTHTVCNASWVVLVGGVSQLSKAVVSGENSCWFSGFVSLFRNQERKSVLQI